MDINAVGPSTILLVCLLISEVTITAFLSYMLDARHKWILFGACVLACVADTFSQTTFSREAYVLFGVSTFALYRVGLPILLSRKSLSFSIVVVVGVILALGVVGVFAVLLYHKVGLTAAVDLYNNLALVMVAKMISYIFLVASLWIVARIVRRFEGATGRAELNLWLMVLPVSQSLFALLCFALMPDIELDRGVMAAIVLFLASSVVVDLICFATLFSWNQQRMDRVEADLVASEAASQQEHQRRVLSFVETVSKLRHDYANQVQVVEYLCSQERFDEAREVIASLKDRLTVVGGTTR